LAFPKKSADEKVATIGVENLDEEEVNDSCILTRVEAVRNCLHSIFMGCHKETAFTIEIF